MDRILYLEKTVKNIIKLQMKLRKKESKKKILYLVIAIL